MKKGGRRSSHINDRVYDLVENDAVLIHDTDLAIHPRDIEFLFRVWSQCPTRIVGITPRGILGPRGSRTYDKVAETLDPRFVLTQLLFVHRVALEDYWKNAPAAIKEMVLSTMNCDDLALNFVASKVMGGTGHVIVAGIPITWIQEAKGGGLHSRPGHYDTRSKCVNVFEKELDFMVPKLHRKYQLNEGENRDPISKDMVLSCSK